MKLEIALQNSSISMEKTSDEEIMALKNQLKEAKTAYNEIRLEVNSIESLKKQLQQKDNEISDLKNSDTREQLCKCEDELQKQKISYENLKKKHAEKIKKFNDLENSYQSSKKETAYNRQQSENIVREKQSTINDLIKNINALNDYKLKSINKKDYEILQEEYRKLKIKYSELLGTYNQGNPQCVNRGVEKSPNENRKLLIIPSMKWIEHGNGQPGGKYQYEPNPRALEHIKEYYACPNFYPKEGPTVEQGYYTQGNNKDDSDESGSDHWDGTYFPSQDRNDFYGDADPYD